jgi:hypothetical protein
MHVACNMLCCKNNTLNLWQFDVQFIMLVLHAQCHLCMLATLALTAGTVLMYAYVVTMLLQTGKQSAEIVASIVNSGPFTLGGRTIDVEVRNS